MTSIALRVALVGASLALVFPAYAQAPDDSTAEPDAPVTLDDLGLDDLEEEDLSPADPADDLGMDDLVDEEEDLEVSGVVVSAPALPDPPSTGGVVQRIDAEQLERFNFDNPDAVVQQVPGAYVRSEDGYGLRPNIGLRGVQAERSSRITLMEDGVLFGPAPYAAPAAYYFPLMTKLSGLDVYVGAATLPYGPTTVAGSIDLRNRPMPDALDGALDLALGNNLFGRTHGWIGAGNRWGSFVIEGVYLRSDGFKRILDVPPGQRDTGFDRGEVLARGELRGALGSNAYHRLELRVGLSLERSNETYLGLTDEDFRETPFARYQASRLALMEWWRTQVELRHTLEVGEDFVLRTAAYRHDLDRAWLKVNAMGEAPSFNEDAGRFVRGSAVSLFDVLNNGTQGRNALFVSILRGTEDTLEDDEHILIGTNARRFEVTGVQSNAVWQGETGPLTHTVRFGTRLHHERVNRNHTEDAYATQSGDLVRVTDESYTILRTQVEALALSGYGTWAVTLWDRLTLTPAIRAELIWTTFEDILTDQTQPRQFRYALIPGLNAEWRPRDDLAIFAGVVRGFAPVSPGQGDEVRAEDSLAYELGTRVEYAPWGLRGLATGFVSDYRNYLQQCSFSRGCNNADIDAQANGGRPLVWGFDLRADLAPTVGELKLPMAVAYTYTQSRLREDVPRSPSPLFARADEGDRLPYLPPHQLRLQAGVEHRLVGANVAGTYQASMLEAADRFNGVDAILTDEYFMVDATAYVRVLPNLIVYLRGENLTDVRAIASRRPFGARPVRPLQVQLGVRIIPDRGEGG